MNSDEQGNAFALPDLWPTSALLSRIPATAKLEVPELDVARTDIDQAQWPDISIKSFEALTFPISDDTAWLQSCVDPLNPDDAGPSDRSQSSYDSWSLASDDIVDIRKKPSRTWEQFADPTFSEPCQYLSEAGIAAFDASIRKRLSIVGARRALKPDVFLRSVFQLALGRDSVLFLFKKDGSLSYRIEDVRVYGLTTEATRGVVERLGRFGQLLRTLRSQVSHIYGEQKRPPTSVATAQAISSIMLELETQITASTNLSSLLQLQNTLTRPSKILTIFRDMLDALSHIESDASVLTVVYDVAQKVEASDPPSKGLLAHVLKQASQPWLRALTACVGLRHMDPSSSFLQDDLSDELELGRASDKTNDQESIFPRWFEFSDRTLVLQIHESMILLQEEAIAGQNSVQESRALTWQFTWADLVNPARLDWSINSPPVRIEDHSSFANGSSLSDMIWEPASAGGMTGMYERIEGLRTEQRGETRLQQDVKEFLNSTGASNNTIQPSFQIAASDSFRHTLAARARVLNQACLQELFRAGAEPRIGHPKSLVYHLRILHRFLLMSDGMFTTRLSHALFDPELASAERSKGRARYGSMGLRLGSRSTWPPASSELQLALMGILTSAFEHDTSSWVSRELPGDLSFALRQLSEEEIEKCLDQASLEAPDFLRVQYRPGRLLNSVITSTSLGKYDQIQKLLLRMMRLVFAINHSSRLRSKHTSKSSSSRSVALRFLHAAHHFVTSFSDYLRNTAIGTNWSHLMDEISNLENAVTSEPGSITEDQSVAYIRDLHEHTLDQIMFACLLRQRHEKVRCLLEDMLRLVLNFASQGEHDETTIREIYVKFTKQVGVFINVCKGLGDRKEFLGKGDGLNALVTRLTMNDFYSSNVERVLRL